MKPQFSEKEYAMIKALSPQMIDLIDKQAPIGPVEILKMVAMDCFINNTQGFAADSLRRCIHTIEKVGIYRFTPEYEKLIVLNDETEFKYLYEVNNGDDSKNCPLCGRELGGCHIGVYCNNENCRYVDGFALLTFEQAKSLKNKLGWGSLEQRQKYWKNIGLED